VSWQWQTFPFKRTQTKTTEEISNSQSNKTKTKSEHQMNPITLPFSRGVFSVFYDGLHRLFCILTLGKIKGQVNIIKGLPYHIIFRHAFLCSFKKVLIYSPGAGI
jgi:hypothetical protein